MSTSSPMERRARRPDAASRSASQGFGIGDLALGQEFGGAHRLDFLVNRQRGLLDADRWAAWRLAGLFLENELRPSQHDFVAFRRRMCSPRARS